MVLTHCEAKSILDSRGKPTLEIFLRAGDVEISAKVPSGKSEGVHEAVELRDADGGMSGAIEKVNKVIAPAIIGKAPDIRKIDEILLAIDGTVNKSNLGANSIIGVSCAVARLAARLEQKPLWQKISEESGTEPSFPHLYMNMINGGVHADFRLPFQEYIVVLDGDDPEETYASGQRIFSKLGEMIKSEFGEVKMGDEGGYSPEIGLIKRPFEILTEAIAGERAHLAIDAAASELFENGKYTLLNRDYSSQEIADLYSELVNEFPLKSIEDPFAEDEKESFVNLLAQISDKAIVVGDDLTVTNPLRLKEMVDAKAANAIIIKPDQVGTLTETFETVRLAHESGWKTIVSHRSGDTLDSFIADLAVGLGSYGIKAGSPLPPERKVKYERLVEIKREK